MSFVYVWAAYLVGIAVIAAMAVIIPMRRRKSVIAATVRRAQTCSIR